MFIIKFIFAIFLIGLVALLFFILRIALTVRKMKERFRSGTTYESQNSSSTTTVNGERITDTRDPEKVQRKIIADDEGEYVDFVEE